MKLVQLCMIIASISLLCLTGCAKKVQKDWFATSGSRSDARIKMAYTYNPQFEIPVVRLEQAIEVATQKCQSWGYDRAEAFGGTLSRCTNISYSMYGANCLEMAVEAEFQCLGKPSVASTTQNSLDSSMTRKN